MPNITRQGWIAFAIAIAVIMLDQLTKVWVLAALGATEGVGVQVLGPLHLTMVHNEGMSFGLFRGSELARWGLTLFSAVVVVVLANWARTAVRPLLAAGLGLIMGGAFGNNLIDRVLYGYVVDFIDVSRLHFPWVFNVADSAITIGVGLLLLDSFLTGEKKLVDPTE